VVHFVVGNHTHRLIIVVAAHKDLFVIAFPIAGFYLPLVTGLSVLGR